jgi:hypothetical protein
MIHAFSLRELFLSQKERHVDQLLTTLLRIPPQIGATMVTQLTNAQPVIALAPVDGVDAVGPPHQFAVEVEHVETTVLGCILPVQLQKLN